MFDRSRLVTKSASCRNSQVYLRNAKIGLNGVTSFESKALDTVVSWLRARRPALWFLGGHVFKANVGWYITELVNDGWVNHLATNGAGLVHWWEMNILGHTSENVPSAIKDGSFGMWDEIALINDVVNSKGSNGVGSAFEMFNCQVTVHAACGQDVFCQHSNYDGAKWGHASHMDFLKLVSTIEQIQGGVLLVFGSAVCAPEVFLKALAMARNVNGGKPDDIYVAVFDCVKPPINDYNRYYHRPSKTLLGRIATQSVFIHGRHEVTIPNLWKRLVQRCESEGDTLSRR